MNGVASQNLQMNNIIGPVGLVINNASGVVLTAAATLPYAFYLNTGILTTTSTNLLTMAFGSVALGASNASFVDGPISKQGSSSFTFPVGKPNCGPSGTVKGYAPLMISSFTGGAISDMYTAEYKRGDALSLGANATAVDHISRIIDRTLTLDNVSKTEYIKI